MEFCEQLVVIRHDTVIFENNNCAVAMALISFRKSKGVFCWCIFFSFIGFYWKAETIEIAPISRYILLLSTLTAEDVKTCICVTSKAISEEDASCTFFLSPNTASFVSDHVWRRFEMQKKTKNKQTNKHKTRLLTCWICLTFHKIKHWTN